LNRDKSEAENEDFATNLCFVRAAKLTLVGTSELPLSKNMPFHGVKNLFLGCPKLEAAL
jgi:hypothetical protein